MKELFLSIMICGMGLVIIGNSHAADTDQVKSSPGSEKGIKDVSGQAAPPDQNQNEYIARLKRINADLRTKHSQCARNYTVAIGNYRKMNSDLQWGYGSLSSQLLKSLQDVLAERTALEAAIKELEQEKSSLRSDVLFLYGGKMPEWLSQEWNREEKAYSDYVDGIYLQVQWSLESQKWKGDEKVFNDYMLEYYRLHQKGPRE